MKINDNNFVHSFEEETEDDIEIIGSGEVNSEPIIDEGAATTISNDTARNVTTNISEDAVTLTPTSANESVVTASDSFKSTDNTFEEVDDEPADLTYMTRAQVSADAEPTRTRSGFPFSLLNMHVAMSVSRTFADEPKTFRQAINCAEK